MHKQAPMRPLGNTICLGIFLAAISCGTSQLDGGPADASPGLDAVDAKMVIDTAIEPQPDGQPALDGGPAMDRGVGECLRPQPPDLPDDQDCPRGTDDPGCRWGRRVVDLCNGEHLYFGGGGGVSKVGRLLTYRYTSGGWQRLESDDNVAKANASEAKSIADALRASYAAISNRAYQSETANEAAADLSAALTPLSGRLIQLSSKLTPEGRQRAQAAQALVDALLKTPLGQPQLTEVSAARAAWMAAVRLAMAIDVEPPARNNPSMVFEPKSDTVVLFGGEGVHGAYNDTWTYSPLRRRWQRMFPKLAPPPRAGGAMVAADGAVYLVGGFQPRGSMSYVTPLWQRLDFDVWRYDLAQNSWTRIRAPVAETKAAPYQHNEIELEVKGGMLSWRFDIYSYGKIVDTLTGSTALPGSDASTASAGQPGDSLLVRGAGFDPAWYESEPLDAAGFSAKLRGLEVNQWTKVSSGVHVNRDWGTIVMDRQRDQLLHWAGGHSSHNGTDVAHFSLATGRWHILYTPELPFQYTYSNDGSPIPSLTGSPWGSHTYASVGVDQNKARMVWMGIHDAYKRTNPSGFFLYDPATYRWQAAITAPAFFPERHQSVVTSTPTGVAVWGPKVHSKWSTGGPTGMWQGALEGADPRFTPVAGADPKDKTTYPPSSFGDRQGMTYDAKRNRLLSFHFGAAQKAHIWATDLKSKQVTELVPTNAAKFPTGVTLGREPVYIPGQDVVVVPTAEKSRKWTLVYDPSSNRWRQITGVSNQPYGVSWGMRYDEKRQLLWGADTKGNVYVMPFDKSAASVTDL